MHKPKVNFMILGAMKCGTSTLASILRSHPDIGFCKKKEPHFFSTNKDWRKNINEYHSLFDFEKYELFGEASTSYTKYPISRNLELWNDIFEYNNKMKFLYIVRNPVDRAISHYMHSYERGYTNLSIEEALKKTDIINTGRYYTQIKPFIDKFGLDNFLIIDFNDLIDNRSQLLIEISDFLNINPDYFSDFVDIHKNKSIGDNKNFARRTRLHKSLMKLNLYKYLKLIPKSFRTTLSDIYYENSARRFDKKPELSLEYRNLIINLTMLDIIELEKITKKDFSTWKVT